jgi:hypothetical protein
MANHFSDIGLHVDTGEEFVRLAAALYSAAEQTPLRDGRTVGVWTDSSGARVVFVMGRHEYDDITPGFVSSTRPAPARNVFQVNGELAQFDLLEAGSEYTATQIPVDLEDDYLLRLRGGRLPVAEVRITAFAEEIQAFPDKESYVASWEDGQAFAEEHLVPVGLFTLGDPPPDWQPSAHVFLGGTVLSAERRTNTFTRQEFLHITARTIGSAEIDIVAMADDLDRAPEPGHIIRGNFYITGRLGLVPGEGEKKPVGGWLKRAFGR